MKKLFSFLLVLAILAPIGLVPVANAEAFTAEPFYVLGWSGMDSEKFPYLNGMPTSQFSNYGASVTISYGGAKVTYDKEQLDDSTVTKFAEAMKEKMDSRPAGSRYWHVWNPLHVLNLKPKHQIYLDFGVDQMKVLMTAILAKYKEIGGQLDGLVVDTEYYNMSSYYVSKGAAKDPLLWKNIVEDPHYATEVRPLLEERGFQFYPYITDKTPEIYSAAQNSGAEYAESRSIWNTVMNIRLAQYLDEWCYEPLKTYFPEASLSDYKTTDSKPWLKLYEMKPGGDYVVGGSTPKAGTASSYSFYFQNPGGDFYNAYNKYAAYNDAIYEGTPFNSLLYEINFAKHMFLSNDMRQIAPWIAAYDYKRFADMDTSVTIINTPYYAEQIYHLGMLDPEPFLAYIYSNSYTAEEYEARCAVVQELMAELTRVAGFSDRKPIDIPPYWNSEFILSGMYAGGRNIWRITPSREVTLEEFKVAGTDLTFAAKGQTVTFPGGKIIEDTAISVVGSYGYWVETPANVVPIITNDPDRFEKYPSLRIDFEDVPTGTFDRNNHKPLNAWEFAWNMGTTTIQNVNGNQVLALTGDIELRSAKLPGKITAGDSYTEDQSWRITVTVPEGMADDAKITLLAYSGTKQELIDGGFQITGGKLYYSTGTAKQEYKALTDIAPGTYVLERAMDFNDPKNFFCTYHVYDPAGKKLASSEKAAIPTCTVVSTIKFATENLGEKALLLDDYTLMVTGLATDFEIYDAALGIRAERDTARDRGTAYRLSWLNATDEEVTAGIMASVYQGDTLVEERVIRKITMKPGCDGVETGEVAPAEGQTVKVWLKTGQSSDFDTEATKPTQPVDPSKPAQPTTPTEPDLPGSRGEKKGPSAVILAAIVSCVIIIAATVIILLPPRKKPAKTEN